MKKFPLLVFDWDGTIVDSIERIVTSLQFASKQVIDVLPDAKQARNVIGLGLIEAVEKLHPQLNAQQNAQQLKDIADAYRQHYLYENKIPTTLFVRRQRITR